METKECKKVKFATEDSAYFALRKIKKQPERDKTPMRAYKCQCGGWHLTSRPDVFELEKDYKNALKEINDLKIELEQVKLKHKLERESFSKKENKELRVISKRDEIRNQQKKELTTLRIKLKLFREEKNDFIASIVKLNNEIAELKNKLKGYENEDKVNPL